MLILLPPSEGKTPATTGPAVALETLSHPELSSARREVADALAKVSNSPDACAALGAGASLAREVERNRTLWTEPTAPAAQVYTGVLYEAADAAHWDAPRLARAAERVRIVSALWGAVSPADWIPAYRLSMSTSLDRIGPLAAYWRTHLGTELGALADGKIIVDCRSAAYVAAWRPAGHTHLSVRVERDLNGTRTVVSHMAKHTRGLLTGALVDSARTPESPADLADVARGLPGVIDVAIADRELTIVLAG
ncbi:YaaA family protein [Demequina sp.]|uniref:YaaA family protein n=1 Tax=Demequina sp. TaxID=2050685 RepID=UPI003A842E6D